MRLYIYIYISLCRRFVGSSDLCDVTYKYQEGRNLRLRFLFLLFCSNVYGFQNARGALFSNLQHADLSQSVNRLYPVSYPDRRNICMMSRLKLRITRITPSIDHRYRILYYLSSLLRRDQIFHNTEG